MQFELKRFWNYLKEDVSRNFWLMLGLVFLCSIFTYSLYFIRYFRYHSNHMMSLSNTPIDSVQSIFEYFKYVIIICGFLVLLSQYSNNKKRSISSFPFTLPISTLEKVLSLFVNLGVVLPLLALLLLQLAIFYVNAYYKANNQMAFLLEDWNYALIIPYYISAVFILLGFGAILQVSSRMVAFFLCFVAYFMRVPIVWSIEELAYYIYDGDKRQYENIHFPENTQFNYFLIPIFITGIILIYITMKQTKLNEMNHED